MIYDPVGGAYAEPALRSIAWYGRFLVVGFAAGEIPKLPLNLVLLKGCDVLGVFWGSWIERDPAGHRANTEQTCCAGAPTARLASHVHAVYPLGRSAGRAEGHRRAQGDGQGDVEALARLRRVILRQRVARGVAMRGLDVVEDQLDRGADHGGIVGQADDRQHVGNGDRTAAMK